MQSCYSSGGIICVQVTLLRKGAGYGGPSGAREGCFEEFFHATSIASRIRAYPARPLLPSSHRARAGRSAHTIRK